MAASPESWRAARDAYESGAATVSDIARALDVSHQAVSKRRAGEAWAEPSENTVPPAINPLDATATPSVLSSSVREAIQAAGDIGRASRVPTWNERAPIEASGAGLTAAVIRQRLNKELKEDKMSPANVRALASAYKDFVSMAQLMAGEATERSTVTLAPEDRAARLRELLGRHFPIETTATDDDSG